MKKAIRLILFGYGVIVLTRCAPPAPHFDVAPNRLEPTNRREWSLKKELEKTGFSKVDFVVPIPKLTTPGMGMYRIILTSDLYVDEKNVDSVAVMKYELANRLYKEIMEDSIIYTINQVDVTLNCRESNRLNTRNWKYTDNFHKDSLEKWNGFKVIKNKGGYYNRVPVK